MYYETSVDLLSYFIQITNPCCFVHKLLGMQVYLMSLVPFSFYICLCLSDNLEVFKKKIISLFPLVYDTKHISYELREVMDREKKWDSNDLSNLYVYFNSGHGLNLVAHTPHIMLTNSSDAENNKQMVHEAGWDSYYTGYCFVRMMHYFAVQNNYGWYVGSTSQYRSIMSK